MFREGSPLRRSFSHRSFKLRKLGSTKSLAEKSPTISNKFSREGSVKSLALPDQLEEEATSGWKSLRRKLSLKKLTTTEAKAASAEATPSSGQRQHPLAPPNINAINAKLLSIVQSVEEEDESPRAVQRKDLPVCWMDHTQVKVKYNIYHANHTDKDIFTRLHIRPATRHLARHIMTYLRLKDFAVAFKVTPSWRNFLLRELDPKLIPVIKRIKTKKRRPIPVPPSRDPDTNTHPTKNDTNPSHRNTDTNTHTGEKDTNTQPRDADTNTNRGPENVDTNPFGSANDSDMGAKNNVSNVKSD